MVIVVLAGVGGTLVATGVISLGGSEPKISEPKPEDQTYGFISDLCGQAQFDDVEDTFAPISGDTSDDFTPYEGFGVQSCSAQLYDSVSEKFGDVRVDVTVFEKSADAKEHFEPDGGFEGYELEKLKGDWMQGNSAIMKLDGGGTRHGAKILDGNLHLSVSAFVSGLDPDEKQATGVMSNLVNNLMVPLVKSEDLKEPPSGNGQSKPKSGAYSFMDDFCEKIDWSSLDSFPFESLDNSEYTADADGKGMSQESCENGTFDDKELKSNAALIFKVSTHPDANAAEKEYKRLKESMETSHKTVTDAEGKWSQGKLGEVGGPVRIETSVVILDDNLTANIVLAFNGDEGTPTAAKKALLDLAGQTIKVHQE